MLKKILFCSQILTAEVHVVETANRGQNRSTIDDDNDDDANNEADDGSLGIAKENTLLSSLNGEKDDFLLCFRQRSLSLSGSQVLRHCFNFSATRQ